MAPASPATIPAATRKEGSLTSSASSNGPPAAAAAHTASTPRRPPAATTPTALLTGRPPRGTPRAARAGLSASKSTAAHSQPDGPPSPGPGDAGRSLAWTIGMVRNSPASACCWSSIRVSPSTSHAPSTRSGRAACAASRASDCASTVSPAMQPARSASGSCRSASRGSARAASHHPVRASLITP
jgi:hypothetical protein